MDADSAAIVERISARIDKMRMDVQAWASPVKASGYSPGNQDAVARLKRENSALQDENTALKARIAELEQNQGTDASAEVQRLQGLVNDLQARADLAKELDDENAQLVRRIEKLEAALREAKAGLASGDGQDAPVAPNDPSEVSEEMFAALKEAFKKFDKDGNGKITRAEFQQLCSGLENMSVPYDWVIGDADGDGDEEIDFNELTHNEDWRDFFVWAASQQQSKAPAEDSAAKEEAFAALKEAFAKFDKDGNGKITRKEFQEMCAGLDKMTVPYDWVLGDADANADDTIDFQELSANEEWRDFFTWAAQQQQQAQTPVDVAPDNATTAAPPASKEESFAALKEAFQKFDKDGDGRITRKEFQELCANVENMSIPFDWVLGDSDANADDTIDFQELQGNAEWRDFFTWAAAQQQKEQAPEPEVLAPVDATPAAMGASAAEAFAALKEAFQKFDQDGDGKITRKEFQELCSGIENMSIPFDWVLGDSDANADDTIDFQELSANDEWRDFFTWAAQQQRQKQEEKQKQETPEEKQKQEKQEEKQQEKQEEKQKQEKQEEKQQETPEEKQKQETPEEKQKQETPEEKQKQETPEEAQEAAPPEAPPARTAEASFEALKEAFQKFDKDGNGKITRKEFQDLCAGLQGMSVPYDWVLGDTDANADDEIDFAEMCSNEEWRDFFTWAASQQQQAASAAGTVGVDTKDAVEDVVKVEADANGDSAAGEAEKMQASAPAVEEEDDGDNALDMLNALLNDPEDAEAGTGAPAAAPAQPPAPLKLADPPALTLADPPQVSLLTIADPPDFAADDTASLLSLLGGELPNFDAPAADGPKESEEDGELAKLMAMAAEPEPATTVAEKDEEGSDALAKLLALKEEQSATDEESDLDMLLSLAAE